MRASHRAEAPAQRARWPVLAQASLLLATAAIAGCGGPGQSGSTSGQARPHRQGANAARAHRSRGPATAAASNAAVDGVLRHTNYITVGTRRRNDVALTFDDGPSPYTSRILAILQREHVKATFFQIGRQAQAYPAISRREVSGGFAVGDHTQTHPLLGRLPGPTQRSEIVQAADHIHAAGAPYPRLFRPPFGSFNAATLDALRRDRMLMVLWTVDTKDFSQPGVNRIVYTALSGARAGAIILMHDGGGPREQTVAALPRIVRKLKTRHFHLVTVPQLLRDDPPPAHQPPPHSLSGIG